jgi:regulator of protease activity HflC (stomatin/prohibitin superfamily)
MSISEILSKKGQLNNVFVDRVKNLKDDWGIEVIQVQVTDFSFDESVKRTMTMQTEADQTAHAKRTIANADKDIAKILKETSDILENPATMKLRELSSLERIASHGNMIIVVPTNAIFKTLKSKSKSMFNEENWDKLHGFGQ